MHTNTKHLSERESCPFCLRSLNPNDTNKELQTFVQCLKCQTIYHECCRPQVDACICRLENQAECGSTQSRSITLIGVLPGLPTLQRRAIIHKGIKAVPIAPPRPTQSPQSKSQPQQAPQVSIAQSYMPPAPAAPSAPSAQRVNSGNGNLVGSALMRFILVTLAFVFNMVVVQVARYIPYRDDLGRYAKNLLEQSLDQLRFFSFPVLAPIMMLGAAVAVLIYVIQRAQVRQVRQFWLTFILGTLAFEAVKIAGATIFGGYSADLYSLPRLVQSAGLVLALCLGAYTVNGIGKVIVTVLGLLGITVTQMALFHESFSLFQAASALVLGTVVWVPNWFGGAVGGHSANNPPTTNRGSAPRQDSGQAVMLRMIGLAIPVAIVVYASLSATSYNTSRYDFYCPSSHDVYLLLETLLPTLALGYLVSRFVLHPLLTDSSSGFWLQLFRTGLICAIGGAGIGFLWNIGHTQISMCFSSDSYLYSPFQGNQLVFYVAITAVTQGILILLSARTGQTRLEHTFRFAILAALCGGVIAGVLAVLFRVSTSFSGNNWLMTGLIAGAALGIATLFYTVPVWFCDWLARGDLT